MDKVQAVEQVKLMKAVVDGDRRAFEHLYRLTSPRLFAIALRMLQHRPWAEEVLHDCYITIWSKAETYNAELSSPLTWMTHIVRNRCIDWLRSGQARMASSEEAHNDALLVAEHDELHNRQDDAQAARLQRCLGNLSSEQRQSITLAYYQGMSHSDIAHWLQQPVGSVKSWIRRAMAHLRECVGL